MDRAVHAGRVVVVGQGYVGLPLAMRAVEVGWDVAGFEVDQDRAERLASGRSYVRDVTDEVLAAALASGRYVATTDEAALDGFDFAVLTVPTPLTGGEPDLSFIEAAGETIALHLNEGSCVILESTTYPGTTEELLCPILERGSGLSAGTHFHLGYSPERIDPGNPSWTFTTTPKVVAGIDSASLGRVQGFYDTLVEQTVPVSSTQAAELSKLLENTFRHVNIALVNELAMFASDLGIDVWEAIAAASTKPFGFMTFTPGPGVGGHCLPIDPSYLSWRVRQSLGQPFRFVELANDINQHMPAYVVRRVVMALNERGKAVKGSRILLLGLAYKKNTGDARESPARAVANQMLALGAIVTAADPFVEPGQIEERIRLVELDDSDISEADLVVVLTDHDAFDLERVAAEAVHVIDTRNCIGRRDNVEVL